MEALRWRRELKVWLPALVFCLLNLAALVGYRVVLAGAGERAERALESRRQELAGLAAERQRVGELATRVEKNAEELAALYGERLGTEGERLTAVLTEVQGLAERAGLRPTSFQYPDDPIDEYGLIERAIQFGVSGTYEQLRRFVNFLELSERFLTLGEVGLSGSASRAEDLKISLRVSTLFVREGLDPVRLATERVDEDGRGAGR